MKTKKSEKKLKLNKITIATLNRFEMKAAVGAGGCPPPLATDEFYTCDKVFTIELKGDSTFWC
jgi:hypothetical protein